MSRITIWYIGNFDTHTNEVIAQVLPAENCTSQVLCQDGHKRDLWQTNYATITRLKNSKTVAYLKFTVYKRDGKYGPVKKYDFPKKKLSQKDKEVKEWLEKHSKK